MRTSVWPETRHVALCGASLLGVKAPKDWPYRCAECDRIDAWDRGVLFR